MPVLGIKFDGSFILETRSFQITVEGGGIPITKGDDDVEREHSAIVSVSRKVQNAAVFDHWCFESIMRSETMLVLCVCSQFLKKEVLLPSLTQYSRSKSSSLWKALDRSRRMQMYLYGEFCLLTGISVSLFLVEHPCIKVYNSEMLSSRLFPTANVKIC